MLTAVVLIITVIANALANVFLKIGAERWSGFGASGFLKVMASPFFLLGILLFILNFPLYSFVLHKMRLAVAFPLITALTFLLVMAISAIYLKEGLNWGQYLGIILLTAGIYLLAK